MYTSIIDGLALSMMMNENPDRQDQFMTTKCHLPKGWHSARRRRCAYLQACGGLSLSMAHQIFAEDSHCGIREPRAFVHDY